jgi:signal peptidase
MKISSVVQKSITAVLVTIALALVIGQALGQPVLIGYVETGSMVPTLAVGDGFVAIPTALAGEVGVGDVVTFEAQSIGGGGITTHRIAEETPEGYITRGDGNTFDDQDAGEPPVQKSQIVAVVFEINGEILVLPSIGNATQAVQEGIGSALGVVGAGDLTSNSIGTVTTGTGVVLIATSLIYGFFTSGKRPTTRSTSRGDLLDSWWILLAIVVVLLLPLMTSMLIPSETSTVQILSMNTEGGPEPTRIEAGTTNEMTYSVENGLFVPTVVVLESRSPGVQFSDSVVHLSGGEKRELSLALSAPEQTGPYARSRSEHHYLHVLPTPIIVALHRIHPYVAMGTISSMLIAPIGILFVLLIGFRPISIRPIHD